MWGAPLMTDRMISVDYIVVKFTDGRATKLDMKAPFTYKKWNVDDDNRSNYDDHFKPGDKIVVQHPRAMDRKQQSSMATVVLVTSKKADADAAAKKLEEQAKTDSVRIK